MKNINILLNLLLTFSSITTLEIQSAAHSSETETKESVELIDSDEIIKAILCNEELAIKLIQSKQINLDFQSTYGETALHKAAYNGFTEIVKQLLIYGANANITNNNGSTPLIYSCLYCNFECAKLLLEHKADINIKDSADWTALTYAVTSKWKLCSFALVNLLLKYDADVNIKDDHGWTNLMYACQYGKIEIAELLLKHGANVNTQENDGDTALIIATQNSSQAIVKLLLNHGADVNEKSFYNQTALLCAVESGSTEIVKLLLEYDADMELVNLSDLKALQIATQKGFTKIVNLIKDKQTLNEYNQKVFKAYKQNDIETCKLLLIEFKKIFPDNQLLMLKNEEKNSLLHEAIVKRDYAFIDYILNYNPEVISDLLNMPNYYGMTPIDLAVSDEYLLNYFMDFAYPPKQASSCIVS